MKNRLNKFSILAIFLLVSTLTFSISVLSQTPGVNRTELQKHDLSVAGREVVQVRVDIKPGVLASRHSHPGEEIVYVIEGLIEYQLDGEARKVYRAGEVLFIPAGRIHSAKNVGKVNAAELATYIVEKGKPPSVVAEK
jgi:quercetin dioxygenase-like cupin family protein